LRRVSQAVSPVSGVCNKVGVVAESATQSVFHYGEICGEPLVFAEFSHLFEQRQRGAYRVERGAFHPFIEYSFELSELARDSKYRGYFDFHMRYPSFPANAGKILFSTL
jgi:hypothetical protein